MLSVLAYSGHFGRPLFRSFCQQLKDAEERRQRDRLVRFITASCGFPKRSSLSASGAALLHSHSHTTLSGDGPKGSREGSRGANGFLLHHTQDGLFGDDAWFVAEYEHTQVIGVADGVGGWRDYGVDASQFPRCLMKQCEKVVKEGRFSAQRPTTILYSGYNDLNELKEPIIGSSTVCIVVLERMARRLYSANLGDSGCLVVREGSIVHRTQQQQHFFNTPFQLAMLPPSPDAIAGSSSAQAVTDILSDRVEDCSEERFDLQTGDLVVVGSDGLFDNLPESHILRELHYLTNKAPDENLLRVAVERLAQRAHQMSHDPHHVSPFSKNAQLHAGLNITGGKPDDITVLLTWVAPPGQSSSSAVYPNQSQSVIRPSTSASVDPDDLPHPSPSRRPPQSSPSPS